MAIAKIAFARNLFTSLIVLAYQLVAVALSLGATAAAVSDESDTVERQVLLLLDPTRTSVRAQQLVQDDYVDSAVRTLFAQISPREGLQKLLMEDLEPGASEPVERESYTPEFLLSNYVVLTFATKDLANRALERFRESNRVLHAAKNARLSYSSTFYLDKDPGESSVGTYQWGTNSLSVINAAAAWDRLRGFAQIGVVDQGVYLDPATQQTHPDLSGNVRKHFSRAAVPGQSGLGSFFAVDDDIVEAAADDVTQPPPKGHGTHVAGLVAANPPSVGGTGMRGACPECSLSIMKLRNAELSMDRAGQLISELVRGGVQVVNLSFGSSANNPYDPRPPGFCVNPSNANDVMCLALTFAKNRGVSIVAASGNNRAALNFPANQPDVLAVGGSELDSEGNTVFWTTGYDELGERVTGGVTCPQVGLGTPEQGSNCSDSADIAAGRYQFLAPALDVLSTFFLGHTYHPALHCGEFYDPDPNSSYLEGGYGTCTGTSMAAPVVSGVVGLMRSANPLLYAIDVAAILKRRSTGNGTPISPQWGWGIPLAKEAVVGILSGANLSNPSAYDNSVLNRLTPLFSLYSSQGRNHLYTAIPQMGSAAINGSIKPSPQYTMSAALHSATCTGSCENVGLSPQPPIGVRKPDGTAAGAGVAVYVENTLHVPGQPYSQTSPASKYAFSDSSGNISSGMLWDAPLGFSDGPMRTANLVTKVYSSYPLTYQSVGNLISGFSVYPGVTTVGIHPRSSVSVYVSHRNPTGSGADLIPLYRLSRKCGDFASPICDTSGAPNYNPFHIGHMYSTDASEVASFTAPPYNYKLDGIEGYVFPKSYSNSPIAGAVRLCRLLDPVRDELVLLPGTGSDGKACNPPFPTYASGSYHSNTLGGTDWIGWVAPNYGGNTPPTVSLTSPSNGTTYSPGVSVTLSAAASDSNGIASVKWFANGVQVASDTSSPYSKTWAPSGPGSYKIYAVATDNNSTSARTTSNPVTIQVNCPSPTPSFANSGFETPSLGYGNYDDAPSGASWTFVPVWGGGQSGISANGSAFTSYNSNAPAGAQVGFIQGDNNYISQTVCFQNAGSFRVRATAAQRAHWNYSYLNLQVYVDGYQFGDITPGNTTYTVRNSDVFTVTPGLRTITIYGVSAHSGQDNSAFIDAMQIVAP